MTQRSVSSIPVSVFNLEDTGCGGSLHGGIKINNTNHHVAAVRVVVIDTEDGEFSTFAFHDTKEGRAELDKKTLCTCIVAVADIYAANEDYSGNFITTTIPGFPGEWLLTMTPFQQ